MRPYLDLLRREQDFRRIYVAQLIALPVGAALAGSIAVFGLGYVALGVTTWLWLVLALLVVAHAGGGARAGAVVLLYVGLWWLAARRVPPPGPLPAARPLED